MKCYSSTTILKDDHLLYNPPIYWALTAYNDIERTLSDLSNVDAINAQYQAAVDWLNSIVDKYNVIDGCVASVNDVGTSCRLTLTVDCTGDALSVLSAHGLLTLDDSLKANQERMENDGYTVVE